MSMELKHKIWLEYEGNVVLGEGRVRLLYAINDEGSLSKGAKSIGMSYKKAWKLLDQMNTAAPSALVETTIGGKDGGGATLTPYALTLLEQFEIMKQNLNTFCSRYKINID